MDTIVQECNECGLEADCIEGICLECRIEIYNREDQKKLLLKTCGKLEAASAVILESLKLIRETIVKIK